MSPSWSPVPRLSPSFGRHRGLWSSPQPWEPGAAAQARKGLRVGWLPQLQGCRFPAATSRPPGEPRGVWGGRRPHPHGAYRAPLGTAPWARPTQESWDPPLQALSLSQPDRQVWHVLESSSPGATPEWAAAPVGEEQAQGEERGGRGFVKPKPGLQPDQFQRRAPAAEGPCGEGAGGGTRQPETEGPGRPPSQEPWCGQPPAAQGTAQ